MRTVTRRRGFSLVEMTIVLVILTLLASIANPAIRLLQGSFREREVEAAVLHAGKTTELFRARNARLPDATEFADLSPSLTSISLQYWSDPEGAEFLIDGYDERVDSDRNGDPLDDIDARYDSVEGRLVAPPTS
jgi:prepilin-type N-terminal cleavage/methylation domain-containing protein